MGDLNALVLKGFGLRANNISKNKSAFLCDTPEGPRMVYKAHEDAARIIFQHELKEHLVSAGFPWVDRYCLSAEGEPYVCVNGELYVMTGLTDLSEPDLSDGESILKITKTIAEWHKRARNVAFRRQIFTQPEKLYTIFDKQAAYLSSIRKQVNRQARLSDFDVLFIKNAAFFTARVKDSAAALSRSAYDASHGRALMETHVCHNALKEENLPRAAGGSVYITAYANACVDLQLNDLSAFIRRYAQKAEKNIIPIDALIEAYTGIFELTRGDIEILWALLRYPHPFIKIVTQYYSKKRTWTPNAITNRMLAVVAERDAYERYIEHMR